MLAIRSIRAILRVEIERRLTITRESKMEFTVEDVQYGNEYKHFKSRLRFISPMVNVKLDKSTVFIKVDEPYLIDSFWLQEKSRIKKRIFEEINKLRRTHFNNQ